MLDTLPLPSTGFVAAIEELTCFTCFTFSPVHLFHLAVGFPCVSVIVYLSIQVESLQVEKSGKSMAIKAHTQHTTPLEIVWALALAICYHSALWKSQIEYEIELSHLEKGGGVRCSSEICHNCVECR